MKMLLSLIFTIGLVAFAHGGVPSLTGKCPDFKPMEGLDAKIAGDWFLHLQAEVGNADTKPSIHKCQKRSVTAKAGTFEEVLTYVDGDGKQQTKNLVSKLIEGTNTFAVTVADAPDKGVNIIGSVLDTDNTNFLVAVFCFTDGSKHGYHVSVFGREKTLAASFADRAREAVKSRSINADLKAVEQNC